MLSLCRFCWFDWFWYVCSVFQVWRHQNFRLDFLYQQWQQKKEQMVFSHPSLHMTLWASCSWLPAHIEDLSWRVSVGNTITAKGAEMGTQTGGFRHFLVLWSLFQAVCPLVSSWYRAGTNVTRLCTSCPQHTCVSYLCPTIPTAFFSGFSFCLLAEC